MNIIPILQLQSNLIASIQTELTDEEALAFQSALLENNQKLQGAKVVLCGVQPAVASTLVDMGMRFISIDTFLSLDHAFAHLTKEQSSNMES